MVMFSATWPIDVHKLAQEFMDPNPVKVSFITRSVFIFSHLTNLFHSLKDHSNFFQIVIGSEDLAANHDVMQIVEVYVTTIPRTSIVLSP